MRRLLVVVALLTAACGGSSPTAPAPTPSTNPTPTVDAKAACGLGNNIRERSSSVSIDLSVVSAIDLGQLAPSNAAGKWFIRVSWPTGQPTMTFQVLLTGADSQLIQQYNRTLAASSTPETSTSATACIAAPAGVYINVPVTVAAQSGVITPTIYWVFPN